MRLGDIFRTWRVTAAGSIFGELYGGLITRLASLQPLITITYSASMTPDLASGNQQTITATNNTAFTINAPLFAGAAMSSTNPGTGIVWSLTIRNTSGGALGAITMNAVFKLNGGAYPSPANAQSSTVTFRWDGTNHVEIGRATAIPN